MAAPNIAGITTITGKSVGAAISTSLASVLSNAAASGKVFKVNTILVSNVDGTNAADATVTVYKNATTHYHMAFTIPVPADSTLVVLSKESPVYLEENDAIYAQASAAGDLEILISYEDIS